MKYFINIDCGTTNSRAYILDEDGRVIAKETRKVGVRDTAIHKSKDVLKEGLLELIVNAIKKAGMTIGDISFIISSGMITSEIGLKELPHLFAPAGFEELAANMAKVEDELLPVGRPVFFVRGIKNRFDPNTITLKDVARLDFMRGEETQIMGLLANKRDNKPLTVVVLSSHTKFNAVDSQGKILGCCSSLSGQLYAALVKETSVGKSIEATDSFDDSDFFDTDIVDTACECVFSVGLSRVAIMPRFLDTLVKTEWYERKLFFEAAIASDDLLLLKTFEELTQPLKDSQFVLVGPNRRCRMMEYLMRNKSCLGNEIVQISDEAEVDSLSILGATAIARKAGLFNI